MAPKTCKTCRWAKPLEEFAPDKRFVSGVSPRCRLCAATARAESHAKHAKTARARELQVARQLRYAAKPEIRQRRSVADRTARAANPEPHRARGRGYTKKYRDMLSDSYVRDVLTRKTQIPRDQVPRELIELKRLHLAINRKLNDE